MLTAQSNTEMDLDFPARSSVLKSFTKHEPGKSNREHSFYFHSQQKASFYALQPDESPGAPARYYEMVFENSGIAQIVTEANGVISHANKEFLKFMACSPWELENRKTLFEFLPEFEACKLREHLAAQFSSASDGQRNLTLKLICGKGELRHILVTVGAIPGSNQYVMSLVNISEQKRTEEHLRNISFQDPLTGLHNRAHFEWEVEQFNVARPESMCVMMCDVDGLKLVNDIFGHSAGDSLLVATANVLRNCLRMDDSIARIGGDEFCILLGEQSRMDPEKVAQRIKDALTAYNQSDPRLPLSLSIGVASSTTDSIGISDLLRQADRDMYHKKLLNKSNASKTLIEHILKRAERKRFSETRTEPLEELMLNTARAMDMAPEKLEHLRLLARFYDIGKVGVPGRILFKPGRLSAEEASEMVRHSEIGYRIALVSPELKPIADWILKHHEWWNGAGYPLGLKGEEIPLPCRLLAIVEAYVAMVSHRPYREALTHDQAVEELKSRSGVQFDPHIASVFLGQIEEQFAIRARVRYNGNSARNSVRFPNTHDT